MVKDRWIKDEDTGEYINVLTERECRERERKAYIKGWRDGAYTMADSGWDSDSDAWAKEEATPEALRRYPEVK